MQAGICVAVGSMAWALQQYSCSSIVQAQESGEHTQIVDDIVYAIDGLGQASSRNSWQDSASTLAEICNTRRGRQAFRSARFSTFAALLAAVLHGPSYDVPQTLQR